MTDSISDIQDILASIIILAFSSIKYNHKII